MAEILLWLEAFILAALSEFFRFMGTQVTAPLWAFLVAVMFGALMFGGGRGARGKASRAYQRIKVRWQR